MRRSPHSIQFLVLLLLVPLMWGFDPFRSSNSNVEQGNSRLEQKKFEQALEFYDKAAKDMPDSAGVQYNRGIALSRLGKLKEAQQALVKGTMAKDKAIKARSFYNLGNVMFDQKKYKEAADAYRSSLRLKPKHHRSKWNLELALRKIKEEKKKQDKQDKDKKQDNKDKQDKQDKNKKQGNKDKQKQDKDKKKKQQNKQDKKKQQQSQKDKKKEKPSDKQMQSVLDALDRNDKNVQRRRARMRGRDFRRPVKDW